MLYTKEAIAVLTLIRMFINIHFSFAYFKVVFHILFHNRSDSDTDDSDIEYVTDERMQTIDITNDAELHEFLENCENNIPQGPIKAKGELRVEDLPPIEELSITVAESDCVQLGTLHSVVDTLGMFLY